MSRLIADPLNQALHELPLRDFEAPSFTRIRTQIAPPPRRNFALIAMAASVLIALAAVFAGVQLAQPNERTLALNAANAELDYALSLVGARPQRNPEILLARIELERDLTALDQRLSANPNEEALLQERVALKRDLLALSAADPVAASALVDAVAAAVIAQSETEL